MTLYTKTNVLFQVGDQSDYNDTDKHQTQYEYSSGTGQVVKQIVAVGTGWTDINFAAYEAVEGLLIENLDSANDIYAHFEVLKNSTTYGATVAFVDSTPDTITDTGSAFLTNLYSIGDKLVVTGSASNNDTFTIQAVVAGTVTLVEADTVVVEAAGATPTIKCYGPSFQRIPAGGMCFITGLNFTRENDLQLACPGGATTAKISLIGTNA